MLYSMTYGIMPTRDQFETAWNRKVIEEGQEFFRFGNCPRMGNCMLDEFELWDELEKAIAEDTAESLDWASCVLYCLGIEWI